MADIDLNKPAFGPGSQKNEPAETPAAPQAEEVAVEEPVAQAESVEEALEEQKVPYSRFKKFHDEAVALRAEAAEWREKAERGSERTVEEVSPDAIWVKLYGDSPESKEAFKLQQQREADLEARAEQRALDAVRNERLQEAKRTDENVSTIDDHFEDLAAQVGRDLTEKETSAVLDIVDDYTPKDADGNYSGPLISFAKAWEIYELKAQAQKAPKQASRDAVAALSGSKNQGESSAKAEQDKNWNPLDWGAYKNRL